MNGVWCTEEVRVPGWLVLLDDQRKRYFFYSPSTDTYAWDVPGMKIRQPTVVAKPVGESATYNILAERCLC